VCQVYHLAHFAPFAACALLRYAPQGEQGGLETRSDSSKGQSVGEDEKQNPSERRGLLGAVI